MSDEEEGDGPVIELWESAEDTWVQSVLDTFPPGQLGEARPFGRGGMGFLFKVPHLPSGRTLVLKMLNPDHRERQDLRARFLRGARALQPLSHPCLPKVHRISEDPIPHLVLDYVEGQTLFDLFVKEGLQSPPRVVTWLLQAAQALAHAHERGVVHRDVNPRNMVLTSGGTVHLIDFDLAFGEEQVRVTVQGQGMGTMGFVAPEQLQGDEPDPRSDVFGLCATGYHLLTGKHPHGVATMAIGAGGPRPLPDEIPQAVRDCLCRGLQLDPLDRHPDMMALAQELAQVRAALSD